MTDRQTHQEMLQEMQREREQANAQQRGVAGLDEVIETTVQIASLLVTALRDRGFSRDEAITLTGRVLPKFL